MRMMQFIGRLMPLLCFVIVGAGCSFLPKYADTEHTEYHLDIERFHPEVKEKPAPTVTGFAGVPGSDYELVIAEGVTARTSVVTIASYRFSLIRPASTWVCSYSIEGKVKGNIYAYQINFNTMLSDKRSCSGLIGYSEKRESATGKRTFHELDGGYCNAVTEQWYSDPSKNGLVKLSRGQGGNVFWIEPGKIFYNDELIMQAHADAATIASLTGTTDVRRLKALEDAGRYPLIIKKDRSDISEAGLVLSLMLAIVAKGNAR